MTPMTPFEFKDNSGNWVKTMMPTAKVEKVIERLKQLTEVRRLD